MHTAQNGRSYLLRLWLEDPQCQTSLRIILINPQTGDRKGFRNFDTLVNFLNRDLSAQSASQEAIKTLTQGEET